MGGSGGNKKLKKGAKSPHGQRRRTKIRHIIQDKKKAEARRAKLSCKT
jgi:hypothetical protein